MIQAKHNELLTHASFGNNGLNNLSEVVQSWGGANEVNAGGRDNTNITVEGIVAPRWVHEAYDQQKNFWITFKGNPATSGIDIVGLNFLEGGAGTSTATKDAEVTTFLQRGNLSAYCDWGDYHLYPTGQKPTNRLDASRTRMLRLTPEKPLYNTESGYNMRPASLEPASTGGTGTKPEVVATYGPRMLLEAFNLGSKHCWFELMDDQPNTDSNWENWFGLIGVGPTTSTDPSTWVPKAPFYTLKRLMGHVADKGVAYSAQPLGVTITGGDPGRRLLFQKRNGTWKLILWRDVTVDSNGVSTVAAENVVLTFTSPRTGTVHKLDNDTADSVFTSVTSVTIGLNSTARVVTIN